MKILLRIFVSHQTANTSVKLTITSEFLRLSDLDTGQAILSHTMPNVSFASGGDADTADYIAYVGKDSDEVGYHYPMTVCMQLTLKHWLLRILLHSCKRGRAQAI